MREFFVYCPVCVGTLAVIIKNGSWKKTKQKPWKLQASGMAGQYCKAKVWGGGQIQILR